MIAASIVQIERPSGAETLRRIVLSAWPGWLALFLVLPCAIVFVYSFFERGTYGGIDYVFTVENYVRAADPLYLSIFLASAKIAAVTTLAALVVGYPAAYLIATAPKQWQTTLLILVMLPFWSNYLIRTYAWIVLLNREGLINNGLQEIGLIGEPLPLLYNQFAIVSAALATFRSGNQPSAFKSSILRPRSSN
jgi:spermidine/putrescine transport system permease protein